VAHLVKALDQLFLHAQELVNLKAPCEVYVNLIACGFPGGKDQCLKEIWQLFLSQKCSRGGLDNDARRGQDASRILSLFDSVSKC